MKYFTPELLSNSRSSEEAVAEQAEREWDAACNKYALYMKSQARSMTPDIRRLVKHSLHDAKVVKFVLAPKQFSIFLLRDDQKEFVLRYSLNAPPRQLRHELPNLDDGEPWTWWLYDELVRDGRSRAWTHSILFTGGRELVLRFSNLQVTIRADEVEAQPANLEQQLDMVGFAFTRH